MTKVLIGQQVKYILRTIQIKNKHLDEILGQLIKYTVTPVEKKEETHMLNNDKTC
jgi:hypothetical protein